MSLLDGLLGACVALLTCAVLVERFLACRVPPSLPLFRGSGTLPDGTLVFFHMNPAIAALQGAPWTHCGIVCDRLIYEILPTPGRPEARPLAERVAQALAQGWPVAVRRPLRAPAKLREACVAHGDLVYAHSYWQQWRNRIWPLVPLPVHTRAGTAFCSDLVYRVAARAGMVEEGATPPLPCSMAENGWHVRTWHPLERIALPLS